MGRKEDKAAKKAERKAALENLRKARKALEELGPDHTAMESDEFLRRNDAVYNAEKKVRFGGQRGWE